MIQVVESVVIGLMFLPRIRGDDSFGAGCKRTATVSRKLEFLRT